MGDPKSDNKKDVISFTDRKLDEDKWHCIELYHTTADSQKGVTLYVDFMPVKTVKMESYFYKMIYDENYIGCGIELNQHNLKEKESLINNFRGEMTTLYFLEVNSKTIDQTHNSLKYVVEDIGLENLVDYIGSIRDLKSEKNLDINIIEKIFMHINPKYTEQFNQFKENTYVINRSGKTIDIKNSVERVYSETIIDHNIMAKDTFINIGGIKTILPTLHKIAYRNPTSEFAYC